ncbi:DDE-type integrase/transposase/recombinase [Paenibacillus sp. 7523-1]|uniref:DDE-type integrase/transposase/recombinase n=1 Tax=Paenibacillus sp. 7523-1 TaxID=2022550 RepID=UPI000BA61A30|nr:DDE-type integrase/transposase/recombinase [Paenibacillus sp. 7523-1]PAD28715.1 hypothetical protein CHH60_23735 [Paenibacillus sp. 7523-1]
MFVTLKVGTRFRIGVQEYEIKKVNGSEEFEVYNLSYDTIEVIGLDEIKIAYNEKNKSRKLLFNIDEKDPYAEPAKWDLELYTLEQIHDMERRYAVIEPYISGLLKDVQTYLENYSNELLPKSTPKLSLATFYRWVNRYNKYGKVGLFPLSRGPKGRQLKDFELEKLRAFIKQRDKKAENQTIRNKWLLYRDEIKNDNLFALKNQQLPLIKESTFRRVYKEMHDPRPRNIQIMGLAHADLEANGVRGSIIAERPLQYVELDWTPIDYIIVNFDTDETFRPIVMHAVDKFSDMPLGYIIIFKAQPNAGDWKQLLLQVMTPKTGIKELYPMVMSDWSGFGKPENIILDNASVNDCEEIEEVCGILGIGFIFNEKGSGHQKGTVENALGNINRIFHAYPGTTFSNNEERGNYNSREKACVDINGLHHMIHIVLVELVANKYNRGIGGIPEQIWREGLNNAKVLRKMPQQRDYIELLLASESGYRVLKPTGIELKGEFFYSEEVNQLRIKIKNEGRSRKVRVRYGIDMRHIYVYDESNKRYLMAFLKQSARTKRYRIDQRFPVHIDHLTYLCNKNNRDNYSFLEEQENVTHALKVLEQIVIQGRKEYAQIKRSRNRKEALNSNIPSAVSSFQNRAFNIPDNPNIIIIDSELPVVALESGKLDHTPDNDIHTDATELSSLIAAEEIDFKKINSKWSVGRKSK